jgi:hypothetical protein
LFSVDLDKKNCLLKKDTQIPYLWGVVNYECEYDRNRFFLFSGF